jgi:hypothetical protein
MSPEKIDRLDDDQGVPPDRDFIIGCIASLAAESSAAPHHCPDFNGKAAAIADALLPTLASHPALRVENSYSQGVFSSLCTAIREQIATLITDADFPDDARGKRRFLLHAWAGQLANMISNRC